MILEQEERILEGASALFWKYGFKSLTMDELARELGVSKKTLYLYHKNKDEIVEKCTRYYLDNIDKDMAAYISQAKDPVHELILISHKLSSLLSNVNDALIFDLKRYYPKAYSIYNSHRCGDMFAMIKDTLQRGIDLGLFRKEINVELLAMLRIEEMGMGFDTSLFGSGKYHIRDIQVQFFDHFIHGITTIKGHKLLNKYQQITEEE